MKLLIYHCREQDYMFILPHDKLMSKLFELLHVDLDIIPFEKLTNLDNILKLNNISFEIWDLHKCNEGYYIPEHTITINE